MREPVIWWVRKDLRLSDNQALRAAIEGGGPVIPVFILDEVFQTYKSAPLWRFGLGVAELAKTLEEKGSRLIVRKGRALDVLKALIKESGARAVLWSRAYDPAQVQRDKAVKSALSAMGVAARSAPGHLLFEPWSVKTKTDGFYRVYSPFWRAVEHMAYCAPLPAPAAIPAPDMWPESEDMANWALDRAMGRGAAIVADHVVVGEAAARKRLNTFMTERIAAYSEQRDFPGAQATSCLSENLAWGEISPQTCWHAARFAQEEGKAGAEHFLKELAWREFAYHLVWHTPHILTRNWRAEWDAFPWQTEAGTAAVLAWKQGRTGIRFVDAAMRELYVTGTMHNRARMIVASYLTKHMMMHWQVGRDWFEDCLIDWDPASNAMGWQWTAGSGPDAAPYFRIFNPDTQLKTFDAQGLYQRRWLAETAPEPHATALSFFNAIPKSWNLLPDAPYPAPVIGLAEGRQRALDAFRARKA